MILSQILRLQLKSSPSLLILLLTKWNFKPRKDLRDVSIIGVINWNYLVENVAEVSRFNVVSGFEYRYF
jgi:hypothetical protein